MKAMVNHKASKGRCCTACCAEIHSVYILQCSDTSYYVGCTNNLEKRLKEHNGSKCGAHYTKIRRPVVLKHVEEFKTLLEARGREAEIKSWKRKDKELLWKAKKT